MSRIQRSERSRPSAVLCHGTHLTRACGSMAWLRSRPVVEFNGKVGNCASSNLSHPGVVKVIHSCVAGEHVACDLCWKLCTIACLSDSPGLKHDYGYSHRLWVR